MQSLRILPLQKKLYPDCGDPPSFASELDDHIKQHNCKKSNKDNLKTVDNLDKFGVPGGLLVDYPDNSGDKITKEEVDNIVAVLRTCGYGAPTTKADSDKAKKAAAAMTAKVIVYRLRIDVELRNICPYLLQLGTVNLSRRSLREDDEEGSENGSDVDDDDDDAEYVVRPSGLIKRKDNRSSRSKSKATRSGEKSKADTSRKAAAKQKKNLGPGAQDAAAAGLRAPLPGGSADSPQWGPLYIDLDDIPENVMFKKALTALNDIYV